MSTIKIKIFTIGVYNSTEEIFFGKLTSNHIDLFCDIRQRRGVRGLEYKYVNSNYLQSKLAELGIAYKYVKELAPTKEIRQMQKDADRVNGEVKKSRTTLGAVFASEYRKQILNHFNSVGLAEELKRSGAKNVVFFCVEEHASACHRSLVASKMSEILNCETIDL